MLNRELQDLIRIVSRPGGPGTGGTAGQGGLEPGAATVSTGEPSALGDTMDRLREQVEQLKNVTSAQTNTIQSNTTALLESAVAKVTGGIASAATSAGNPFLGLLKGGFGLSPVVTGLMKLFNGESKPAPLPPLPAFSLPAKLTYEAGLQTDGSVAPISYGQTGVPRPVASGSTQPIQVVVQTMDSRSFLDHSDQIARAVREAMLHSHPINDVIQDL